MVRRRIDTRPPFKDGPSGLFPRRDEWRSVFRHWAMRTVARVPGHSHGEQSRGARCDDPPTQRALSFSGTVRGYSGRVVRKVLLASPRGYCAGVERAVETVEKALDLYGPPVYV